MRSTVVRGKTIATSLLCGLYAVHVGHYGMAEVVVILALFCLATYLYLRDMKGASA